MGTILGLSTEVTLSLFSLVGTMSGTVACVSLPSVYRSIQRHLVYIFKIYFPPGGWTAGWSSLSVDAMTGRSQYQVWDARRRRNRIHPE